MSTFIIFGATGATGGFLLPDLLARGERVYAVSRRTAPGGDASLPTWIHGDLFGKIDTLPAAADVIVSLGPLDAFAAWFAASPVAGVRRVIALSSMSAASKRESADPRERELSATLRIAEERLLRTAAERQVAATVLRATLIYGGGPDRSLVPIARFALRWRVLPIPLGAHGLRQPVHAADLASAVGAVLDCAAAQGRTYDLGGGERLRFDRMLWRLRAAMPQFVLPLPLPQALIQMAVGARARGAGAISRAAIQRLRSPLIADNDEAARDFGYSPRLFCAADVIAAASR